MGFFFNFHKKHRVPQPHRNSSHNGASRTRICRIEQMESRQLLSATVAPLNVGAVYFEDSNDYDQSSALTGTSTQVADLFQIGYTGGADGTNLTTLTIDLDNTFFDTASGGKGAYGCFPLKVLSHDGFNVVSSSVTDGGTQLKMTFSGFDAGEKLVFTIDVDEDGNLQPNAVAEGAELEGATLTTTFTADHMEDLTNSAGIVFYDSFDFSGTGLTNLLPDDNYTDQGYLPENCSDGPVYTAGAHASLQQTPKPITISGTVFEDYSTDNVQQSGEPGIKGVTLTLWELEDGVYVKTSNTTTTDSNGNYTFKNLLPGTYRIIETQPNGYLSVGDTPGTVDGETRGSVSTVDILTGINLEGGDDSIDNDFAEVTPAQISGYVYHDRNNDGYMDVNEEGIADVHIKVVSVSNGTTYDAYTGDDGSWSVTGLMPGQYNVTEVQPSGWLDGLDAAGTAGGTAVNPGDKINGVYLIHDQSGQDYDFGELKAASVSGYVYVDADNDGVFDSNETPILAAKVTLLDEDGNTVATKTTDELGYYSFTDLTPGTYTLTEVTPDGYYDGLDTAGSLGGTAHNPGDKIDAIPIASGDVGTQYDFGELLPASISGKVYVDLDDDGTYDSTEKLLSGVTIWLLDSWNNRVKSTTTASDGTYSFTNLEPGVYGVEEIQPSGYLEGWNQLGSASGTLNAPDEVTSVTLGSGVAGTKYDFWENLGATISGYVFVDGGTIVVQEGESAPYIPSVRDGVLTADDTRLSGITLQLCDGSGVALLDSNGDIITTTTDANGYYEFSSLESGLYTVVQVEPTAYEPSLNTAGTAGGIEIGAYQKPTSSEVENQDALIALVNSASGSAIARIYVGQGETSADNNFSSVLLTYEQSHNSPPTPSPTPFPFDLERPAPIYGAAFTPVGLPYSVPYAMPQTMAGGSGGPSGYTWHLSIIDAGQPRRDGTGDLFTQYPNDTLFDPVSWTGGDLTQSQWILADENGTVLKTVRFGMQNSIPVTGDWNGSGTTKVGVFINGLWFLDINGNGAWDEADLWAKLGKKEDQPVAGDWNGDGKTDIGIYGPAWIGDLKAISVEPGMPDAQNPPGRQQRPKNVPPDEADAAVGWRTMKKGNAGKMRSDVIDHVFEYGQKGDHAVVGDWNGDGIYTVGVYRNGSWYLDMDGDGKWSDGDVVVQFGQEGDLPIVGDWTGDGISKLGIYRNGTFYLDTNNNRQLDAADKVFQLGHAGDKPVVGDWTGDGIDKVGVFQDAAAPSVQTATSGNAASAGATK